MDKLADGTHVLIRSIRDGDIDLERVFIERLSPESRRFRFLGELSRPSDQFLARLVHPRPTDEAAFVALISEGATKREIGVARFSMDADGQSSEFAVCVADDFRHRGLDELLMKHLIGVAKNRGVMRMYSIDAVANSDMRELAHRLGFKRSPDPGDACQVIHTLDLAAT
jgi:GNAT superfamily N-acetyltransferase